MNVKVPWFLVVIALFIAQGSIVMAQTDSSSRNETKGKGKVFVSVSPKEAYIWVDGKPVNYRSTTLRLPPGDHSIGVYNYGFFGETHKVTVAGNDYQKVIAHLKPVPGTVKGPWGKIQIEGVPGDSLVFMNGTSPDFFVAHEDEMNDNFWMVQTLVAPVGTHQLYIVSRKTNQQLWSGQLDVKENKRLILYVRHSGKADVVYKDWAFGKEIKELKRFHAGIATAVIAVPPVTGQLAVNHQDIKCQEPVKVSWNSTESVVTSVTANDEKVAESAKGELAVQPRKTTKYVLRAVGPGGTVVQEASVAVDPKVEASLTSSAPDVRYVKVGDQVKEQGTADLKWSASNADSVTLQPFGVMSGDSGIQKVQANPSRTDVGPLDETETYQLTATNVCGGSETKTVALRTTGSIEPAQIAQAEPPPELPQTASPLPLLALMAFASIACGLLLTFTRR